MPLHSSSPPLSAKRAREVEMRLAITTHCQLEAGAVDALLIRDLEGFATELRARMATEYPSSRGCRMQASRCRVRRRLMMRNLEGFATECRAPSHQALWHAPEAPPKAPRDVVNPSTLPKP